MALPLNKFDQILQLIKEACASHPVLSGAQPECTELFEIWSQFPQHPSPEVEQRLQFLKKSLITKCIPFESLERNLVQHIFSFLSLPTQLACAKTNQQCLYAFKCFITAPRTCPLVEFDICFDEETVSFKAKSMYRIPVLRVTVNTNPAFIHQTNVTMSNKHGWLQALGKARWLLIDDDGSDDLQEYRYAVQVVGEATRNAEIIETVSFSRALIKRRKSRSGQSVKASRKSAPATGGVRRGTLPLAAFPNARVVNCQSFVGFVDYVTDKTINFNASESKIIGLSLVGVDENFDSHPKVVMMLDRLVWLDLDGAESASVIRECRHLRSLSVTYRTFLRILSSEMPVPSSICVLNIRLPYFLRSNGNEFEIDDKILSAYKVVFSNISEVILRVHSRRSMEALNGLLPVFVEAQQLVKQIHFVFDELTYVPFCLRSCHDVLAENHVRIVCSPRNEMVMSEKFPHCSVSCKRLMNPSMERTHIEFMKKYYHCQMENLWGFDFGVEFANEFF